MHGSRVKWKLLVSTPDEAEAFAVKSRLEAEGVACRLESVGDFPSSGGDGKARRLKVLVPVGEFEASLQVMEEDLEED